LLPDDQLIVQVRKLSNQNQRLPVLLLLAHVEQPAATGSIIERGLQIGFRKVRDWNVTQILTNAENAIQVVKRPTGWQLLEPGLIALIDAGVDLVPRRSRESDSVIPRELFAGTRGYIEKVVTQINSSYDHELYDCCAVMCRRLCETLIIEVYEAKGRAESIKGKDGNFQMLNGLLSVVGVDAGINLGRNAKRGLESLKDLGDKSAHNRRFNARRTDIDGIRADFRVAAEELLHVAMLVK
jgi:hypothetical protein